VYYVDVILIIASHKPQEAMDYLSSKYKLKEGRVKEPDDTNSNPMGEEPGVMVTNTLK
jgi:hypothetical protein